MHIDVDHFAHTQSIFHSWNIQFKVFFLFLLIIAVSFTRSIEGALCSTCIAITAAFLSKIPMRYMVKKTIAPVLFLVPLFLILPFTSDGKILYQYSIVTIYFNGVYLSAVIFFKTFSIVILFI